MGRLPVPAFLRRSVLGLEGYLDLRRKRQMFRRGRISKETWDSELEGGIVVFAPNAGFPSMLSGLAIVAKTLAARGYPVVVVSCGMSLRTCTVMDGMAPVEKRPTRRLCSRCMDYATSSTQQYGLPRVDLGDLLTPAVRSEAVRLVKAWSGPLKEFVHDGAPIGGFAVGNLAAIWKRDEFDEADAEANVRIRLMVEECLAVKLALREFLVQIGARHLIYYAEYALELSVAAACQELGVKVTPILHSSLNGNDFRRLTFVDKVPQLFDSRRRIEDWPNWRPLALDAQQIRLIADDTVARLLGRSGIVFSPPLGVGGADLLSSLGLKPERKTLVAFTSSNDEHNNVKKFRGLYGFPFKKVDWPFADQADWLRHLCQYVSDSDDLQLVVRFHPRLGRTRGSFLEGDYSDQLNAVESGDFKNVHVILPEDKVSSYGLAEISDVVLPAWTSLGPESARLGMPVIQAFFGENSFPVGGFLRCPTTPKDYFSEIRRACGEEPNYPFLCEAFRFAHMYFAANDLDFGDLVSSFDDPMLPNFRMPAAADDVVRFTVGGEVPQKVKLDLQKSRQSAALKREETRAIREALARFIHVLAFGADVADALDVVLSDIGGPHTGQHGKNVIDVRSSGDHVSVSVADKQVTKRSPMILNLARLAQVAETHELTNVG